MVLRAPAVPVSVALLALSFVLAGPLAAAAPDPASFVPTWRQGDRWLVKTETRRLSMTEEGPKKSEDEEVWIFKVAGVRDHNGRRFFQILARSWKTPPVDEAAFLFVGTPDGSGGVSSLALVRAAYRGQGAPEVERFFDRYSPAPYPVINDFTPVPSTFPLFDGGRLVGPATGLKFNVSERLESMVFARDVRQAVSPVTAADVAAVPLKLPGATAEGGVVVDVTRAQDSRRERQIWHRDQPWFLYAESPTTRSWLVRVKRAPMR